MTEIEDLINRHLESNCCGAPVYTDSDICTCCGEHCEVIDPNASTVDCPDCDGKGVVDVVIKESFASPRIDPRYEKRKCSLCDGSGIIENIKD